MSSLAYISVLERFFIPYLDTTKYFCYLFLGIGTASLFWNSADRSFKRGIESLNPIWFLMMTIWGASGYFFLSFIPQLLQHVTHHIQFLDNLLVFIFTAVPDWDIPIYILAKPWVKFVNPQALSWLFASSIVPIFLIFLSKFIPLFLTSLKPSIYQRLNDLFSVGMGLSIGVSAHLFGDITLTFIPRGDTGISIYDFSHQRTILLWLIFNILSGIIIPYFFIWMSNLNYQKNVR